MDLIIIMPKLIVASVIVGVCVALSGPAGTCGLEDCGSACNAPNYPPMGALPLVDFHPDPFAWANGTGRITTKEQW